MNQRKTITPITPWDCDAIQFPRLLAAIAATQPLPDEKALREATDLSQSQIRELFARAQKAWDDIKVRTTTKSSPYAMVLDERFAASACGNIWLVNIHDSRIHLAWIRLQGDIWLEIAIWPNSHPGLTVRTIQCGDQPLAARINHDFNGGNWCARVCNIKGVRFWHGMPIIKGSTRKKVRSEKTNHPPRRR